MNIFMNNQVEEVMWDSELRTPRMASPAHVRSALPSCSSCQIPIANQYGILINRLFQLKSVFAGGAAGNLSDICFGTSGCQYQGIRWASPPL